MEEDLHLYRCDRHGLGCMQVERGNVKAPPAVEEVYQGVAAPSRLKVDDAAAVTEMPKVT